MVGAVVGVPVCALFGVAFEVAVSVAIGATLNAAG